MSTESTTAPGSTKSPHFQFPDADLIIRTSDKVTFHVHKTILSFASRVFRDMLSLDNINPPSTSEQRVVDVSEDSSLMDATLRYFYPLSRPILKSLIPIILLLEVADKYDIPVVTLSLEDLLLICTDIVYSDPPRAYTVARKFNLRRLEAFVEPIILKKSDNLLGVFEVSNELHAITLEDLKKLEFYRSHRVSKAGEILRGVSIGRPPPCQCRRDECLQDLECRGIDPSGLTDDELAEREARLTCDAWTSFILCYLRDLRKDPLWDISQQSLREEVIAADICDDAKANLSGFYREIIAYVKSLIECLPWTFPEEWRARQSEIHRRQKSEREMVKFVYNELG